VAARGKRGQFARQEGNCTPKNTLEVNTDTKAPQHTSQSSTSCFFRENGMTRENAGGGPSSCDCMRCEQ
jgi:hypothetical protein